MSSLTLVLFVATVIVNAGAIWSEIDRCRAEPGRVPKTAVSLAGVFAFLALIGFLSPWADRFGAVICTVLAVSHAAVCAWWLLYARGRTRR